MTNILSLQKLAPTLTGTEKARLIAKDFFEKSQGNKTGFLTDADMVALKIKDSEEQEEFRRYINVCSSVPDIIIRLLDAYICFTAIYQELKVSHFRLGMSRGLHEVSRIITNNIMKRLVTKDEYKKMVEDALNETVSVKELVED